jgi:hypothetical protein
MSPASKVPVVAVVTESVVARPMPVVTSHFNVAALTASAVVMVCALIGALVRFTAGVEGFNSRHGASCSLCRKSGIICPKSYMKRRLSLPPTGIRATAPVSRSCRAVERAFYVKDVAIGEHAIS